MEYVQMTLNEWVEIKQKLRQELLGVKQSFVRIGYMLRQIDDQKGYEQDGYKSIAEFAEKELGLHPSTTTRFMEINREYSIDGYSERLREEYLDLGRSQLEEMLKLPDSDRQMIQPETSREDIRELKRFNKSEPEAGEADDLRKLIETFFEHNKEVLNAVFAEPEFTEDTIKRFAEIVNPGGNRSYKKGLYFLMMYENRVTYKKFGETPQNMTWWQFYQITRDIFGGMAAGSKTWENYFGGQDEPEEHTEVQPEVTEQTNHTEERSDTPGERAIAPAQKSAESPETLNAEPISEPDEIPGQTELTRDFPEYCPDTMNPPENPEQTEGSRDAEPEDIEQKEEQDVPENGAIAPAQKSAESPETLNAEPISERPYGSRKQYLDTLTEYGAALYITAHMANLRNITFPTLLNPTYWEKWLRAEVDEKGEEIDVVE